MFGIAFLLRGSSFQGETFYIVTPFRRLAWNQIQNTLPLVVFVHCYSC